MADASKVIKLQEIVAHELKVNSVAFGNIPCSVMATGGNDKRVNLWSTSKSYCITSLKGHNEPVECVKFGLVKEVLCAGTASGSLKLWDLEAIKISTTLSGHKLSIKCIDFHPFGEYMSSASADTNIKLWDNRRKGCIYTYKGHCFPVNSLNFSPDGKLLVSGCNGGIVKLWDLKAGKLLSEFGDHCSAISDVKFHPSEFVIASASDDGIIKFWNLETFQLISTNDEISGAVRRIKFSTEGECLFSGAQNILKSYGWKPFCTYDSLDTDWHSVDDMCAIKNHLFVASYHSIYVSVHMINLSTIYPFKKSCSCSGEKHALYEIENKIQSKKSFTKVPQDSNIHIDLKEETDNPDSSSELENDSNDFECLNSQSGIIGMPAKTKNLTQHSNEMKEENLLKTNTPFKTEKPGYFKPEKITDISEKSLMSKLEKESPFVPFMNDVQENVSKYSICEHKNLRNPYLANIQENGEATTSTNSNQSVKQNSQNNESVIHEAISKVIHEANSKVKSAPIEHPLKDPPFGKELFFSDHLKNSNNPHVPFWHLKKDLDRDSQDAEPVPSTSQRSQSTKSDLPASEFIDLISKDHESTIKTLNNKKSELRSILQLWKEQNIEQAIQYAAANVDQGTLVDLIKIITLRPQLWTLSICQKLLPHIYNLISNKNDEYRKAGYSAVKVILNNFLPVIKANLKATPCIGVDLSRDERHERSAICYQYLLSIQRFTVESGRLQGVPEKLLNDLKNI